MQAPFQQNELFSTDTPKGVCIERSAVIDSTGLYRYRLERVFATGESSILFCLLNPSTADGKRDDPTLLQCMRFASAWGYQRLVVVNIFAYRSPSPGELRKAADPVGSGNDRHITEAARDASAIIVGWGRHGSLQQRDKAVCRLLAPYEVFCLGMTPASQQPRHPLYLALSTKRIPFSLARHAECGSVHS